MKRAFRNILLIVALFFFNTVKGQETLEQKIKEYLLLAQGGEIQTNDGLLAFCHNDKCGFIDSSGTIVVKFKYDFVKGFYNGLAAVNIGGEWNDDGFPEIKGGKWALVDESGNEITDFKYDYIPAIEHGYFGNLIPVELNGKQGLINREGKEVTSLIYDYTNSFNDSLWTVQILDSLPNNPDGVTDVPNYWSYYKYGLVGVEGKLTDVKYSKIQHPFSDGFTLVRIEYFDEKSRGRDAGIGIIDQYGKEIIPPKYHYIETKTNEKGLPVYFSNDLAAVCLEPDKCGYINKKGETVIPINYLSASPFFDGMAIVSKIGDSVSLGVYDGVEEFQYTPHYGTINTSGKAIIPLEYDNFQFIPKHDLIKVSTNQKWGILKLDGKKVTPIKYDKIKRFRDGLAIVELNGKSSFINEKGKELIPFKYDEIWGFSEGEKITTMRLDKKWGCIDKTGKVVIPLKYESHIMFYSKKLAPVELNGKFGYINRNGKVLIPFKYDTVNNFSDGKARVRIDKEWFEIDETGNRIE
jgi:hypothetical protein